MSKARSDSPSTKGEKFQIRLEPDLAQRAKEKATRNGWQLSAVMRALLWAWVDRDLMIADEVGNALQSAPRGPKPKRKKK